ncbi:hypothetical protein [Pandoraea commovens]|uniref:Uncharacterized protein n=1 Tax=Pandoraea commovens TaxID=2508289 RepID=A0A5E4WIM8_9BURK|nr:hypothetical protein [Pandoraea commovens]UVA80750.1 hypothetical protein NTU39_07020 [Pandoraea commovens]VVE23434.1 hypothetical protein PCO31010_03290 [Pandoraea commovens]
MTDASERSITPHDVGSTKKTDASKDKQRVPTLPPSFPRKGYVIWFHAHARYLGYAWDEEQREIQRAHVPDPDHAIYFDTFAEAMVATERLFSPYYILHSPKPGANPKLVR